MAQEIRRPVNDHIGYLDSVRGIAAIMVLVYHYMNWHYHTTGIKVMSIFFNGDNAVSFFFVLSGYVLSYKYLVLDRALDVRHFFVNRLFRLLPGFFVAVILMSFMWNLPLTFAKLSDIFIYNNQEIYQELFLFRTRTRFYGAGWTLGVELLISMMVPFMVAIARKDKKLMTAFVGCLALIGGNLISRFHIHFALGVILSTFYYQITSDDFKSSRWYKFRWLIIPFGILLFTLKPIHELSPLGPTLIQFMNYMQIDFYLLSGIGAFILLAALIRFASAQKFFDIGLWRFYGKISYGMYLIHWLVVSQTYDHWDRVLTFFPNEKMAFVVTFIFCFATSTLLATILHYTIELPFMRYGKKLVHKLKPGLVIK